MSDSYAHETRTIHWAALLRPRWLLAGFVIVLVLLRGIAELIPTRVVIGPETTVLDGPVRADGMIDYAAVVDAEWSEGVVPEENAVVDIIRAFDRDKVHSYIRKEYLDRLGISSAASGDVFLDFYDFLEEIGIEYRTAEGRAAKRTFDEAQTRAWTADEFPLVAEWLERNKEPLQHILSASGKPSYYPPVVIDPADSGYFAWALPAVNLCRGAARLLLVRAMNELGQGDLEAAFRDTLACHRFARLVSQHPTCIGALVAKALDSMAMSCDGAIILSNRLADEQARRFRKEFLLLPEFCDPVEIVNKTERFCALSYIDTVHRGRLPDQLAFRDDPMPRRFDPNPALRAVNKGFDDIVTALRLPDYRARIAALKRIESRSTKAAATARDHLVIAEIVGNPSVTGQWYADIVPQILLPETDTLIAVTDGTATRVALAEYGYALAEYHAGFDHYPPELESLVPDYLDAVPLDPFTGDPLKYELTDGGFLLYSVGPNETDDGGFMDFGGDDIAFGDTPDEDE